MNVYGIVLKMCKLASQRATIDRLSIDAQETVKAKLLHEDTSVCDSDRIDRSGRARVVSS